MEQQLLHGTTKAAVYLPTSRAATQRSEISVLTPFCWDVSGMHQHANLAVLQPGIGMPVGQDPT